MLGTERKAAPDLAIEVVWTHGGLDKLEICRGLGVREVWIWRDDRSEVHELRGANYAAIQQSGLFPDLDLQLLATFLDRSSQTQAVRQFRAVLRGS
jgi:Uma2 family endonuclease